MKMHTYTVKLGRSGRSIQASTDRKLHSVTDVLRFKAEIAQHVHSTETELPRKVPLPFNHTAPPRGTR